MVDLYLDSSSPERERLLALCERSNRRGLERLSAHLLLLLGSGTLAALVEGAILVPLALAVHGTILIALFAPLHECLHRTAFRSRPPNELTGSFIGLLLLLPKEYFRAFHLAHHRHTQDPARDPELAAPKPSTLGAYLLHVSGIPYWVERIGTLLRHASGRMSEEFIPVSRRPRITAEARAHAGIYLVLLAASIAARSDFLLLFWVLPALLGQPMLRLYLLAEHTGCPTVPDMLRNTRTTRTAPWIRWLAWNMPFHAEHHVCPAIPFHALPRAHAVLEGRLECMASGYREVHSGLLRQLLRSDAAKTSRAGRSG